MKSVLAAALAVALVVPAVAQTTEFYVVHEPKTKKCTIGDTLPTTTTTAIVDGKTFNSRVGAQTAMTMKILYDELIATSMPSNLVAGH